MAELDLKNIAAEELARRKSRSGRVYCCSSTGCLSSGAGTVLEALKEALASHGLREAVDVIPTGCMGLCSHGPLLGVEIGGEEGTLTLYQEVNPLLTRLIVAEHILPAIAAEGDFRIPDFLSSHVLPLDLPFFTRQKKVVLANAGRINPERIEEYIAAGGYRALEKVLKGMTPDEVIAEVTASGLRGRGGGGYPTGLKWRNTADAAGKEKYIICNGDEGDPGAYMDRSILEGDPHAVIEGLLIAGYAAGATSGWFYIRAEYPLAVERVEAALKTARGRGLLGENILGSGFSFDCRVRLGAGAFVCGEETALIASIEGKRGTPRPRPPYPSQAGLWDYPSCVNNVETLANVPAIIRRGAGWYSGMGTETSKGTKVFALTGKARYSGLIEVPMGTTLREIVEEIGGGSSSGRPLKAIQTGGPSGGVIPVSLLDTPVCYEKFRELGSIMGSGGMIVMDDDDSMVSIAAFYLEFTVDESCGKCVPCRIGGKQMLDLLKKIAAGKGSAGDLAQVRRLSEAMRKGSLCGLGQTAPNPVDSALRYFEREYLKLLRTEND